MKNKKSVLIAALLVILAVVVLVVIFYKPVPKEDVSGTIANQEIIKRNIEIKETLTTNQTQLSGIIKGLDYFDNYVSKLSSNIETSLSKLEENVGENEFKGHMQALQDFKAYLEKNQYIIKNTRGLLTDIGKDKVGDSLFDIKDSLKNFDKFVIQIYKRDTIVRSIIDETRKYIKEFGSVAGRKDQINSLMAMVDEMVVQEAEHATVMKDGETAEQLKEEELYNKQREDSLNQMKAELHQVLNTQQMKMYEQARKLASNYDKGNIGLLPLFDIKNLD